MNCVSTAAIASVQWPQPSLPISRWPRISIITPTLNQAAYLEATILSIVLQNYPNLEYIVIDGGSVDGTSEILAKYRDFISYSVSEADENMYAAIAKGMRRATGDIVAWLNSDDLYLPWTLSVVASVMDSYSEVEWITTLQPVEANEEGVLTNGGRIPGFSREAFLAGTYLYGAGPRCMGMIPQPPTFWRRSLWNKIEVEKFAKFAVAGDFFLWAQFFRHAELYGVEVPLAGFRVRSGQKSELNWAQYLDECRQCLKDERDRAGWSTQVSRDVAFLLQLDRLPKLKHFARKNVGYLGKRIARERSNDQWSWAVEAYKFL